MSRAALTTRLATALSGMPGQVVITGGGGWLGLASLDLLERLLGDDLAARVKVYGSRARMLTLPSGRNIPCSELSELARYDGAPPLVLHYACLTKDRVSAFGLAAFLAGNDAIRRNVIDFIQRCGAQGIFLPSSGAVYGPARSLTQDTQGNPYGVCKLQDEAAFSSLAASRAIPLVVARVFNIAGPFINKPEAYALSSFLLAILQNRPIEIRAAGRVVRSYVHIDDLLTLALAALLLSPNATPYYFDTSGEISVEVEALATRAATVLGRPDTLIRRAKPDGRGDDVYVGDGAAMRRLAGAVGLEMRNLEQQIHDTASYLARDHTT